MREKRVFDLTLQLSGIIILTLFCILLCCPPSMRPEIFGLKGLFEDYKVNYGLDLKGGSELLYQVDPKEVDPTRNIEDVVDETIEVISQRIDASRVVKDPRIQRQGSDRILIQLPGLNQLETEQVKKEIETLGNLEFRLVASKKIGKEIDEQEERSKYEQAKQRNRLLEYEKNLLQQGYRWFSSRDDKAPSHLLWVNDGYNFSGTKFRRFYPTLGDEGQVIGFELKEEFKPAFARFTEKYKGQRLAILFNNKVSAAPNIKDRIPGIGIMVGFHIDELKDLLKVLRSGSLEIQPELLNENTIGPSLGEDTIRLGIKAGILGMGFVIVFMSLYYFAGGIIASCGAILNVLIVFAVMVILKETLTLPGIAGIALTLGMSVDANILIMERIREEKKRRLEIIGKGTAAPASDAFTKEELLEYVDKGYHQAFRAIFDSNVTTLITAIILYIFATGPVQGFAFTLGIGLLANLFTAITFTKITTRLMIELGVVRKMVMMELVKNTRIAFSKYMPVAGMCSLIVVIAGTLFFFSRGQANYGLDLKGGILAHISLEKPLTTDKVRERMGQKFQVEVQNIETPGGSSKTGWFEFAIRLPNFYQAEIEQIEGKLRNLNRIVRQKNEAIQDYSNKATRIEEEQVKEARRELRKLEEQKASKDQIEDMNRRIRSYEEELDRYKKALTELGKEADRLKSGLMLLSREDIKNVPGLVNKLKDAKNPVSLYLSEQLSANVRRFMEKYDNSGNIPEEFIKALIESLNQVIQSGKLYDKERFAQVKLQDESKLLLAKKFTGKVLTRRIGRLLIQDAYPDEITPYVDSRSELISAKNELAGIEELRNEIETQFKVELSPIPFTPAVKTERGMWSNFYQTTVNLATPVSLEFAKDTLKKQQNFRHVEFGSAKYEVLVKLAAEIANPEAEIASALEKHLDLVARIAPASTPEVKKVTTGADAGYFAVNVSFKEMVPEFAMREVLAKGGFADFKLSFMDKSLTECKSFQLFIELPWEFVGNKSAEDIQKHIEDTLTLTFKDIKYQGNVVYLSSPFQRFTQLAGVVAEAQKAKAYQAIFLALLGLLFYIAWRFPGFRYGIAAVFSLAHNVFITLGAIALFSYFSWVSVEIDLSAIAALLTIVGYSINDTIVIFDFIRDRQLKNEIWDRLSANAIAREFDATLNQTLSRTLLTGTTTLAVLLSMFLLNYGKASVLEGFSFILLSGVIVGTYSSVFIASYLVLRKEQKNRISE